MKAPHSRSTIPGISWCGLRDVLMDYGPSPCPECNAAFLRQVKRLKKGNAARKEQAKTNAQAPYFNRGKPE